MPRGVVGSGAGGGAGTPTEAPASRRGDRATAVGPQGFLSGGGGAQRVRATLSGRRGNSTRLAPGLSPVPVASALSAAGSGATNRVGPAESEPEGNPPSRPRWQRFLSPHAAAEKSSHRGSSTGSDPGSRTPGRPAKRSPERSPVPLPALSVQIANGKADADGDAGKPGNKRLRAVL
ncbi:hypothetical protein HPB47_027409 [Ixodes persulcatus]|uniref:Uncharacterized protein n=1 Tax=Ixodes persulcatus TaxID=34615 RepID=A0AC60PX74_IXOPE|nr:hypothetical protein HPB47_027409 [Ixodes persulcatus]